MILDDKQIRKILIKRLTTYNNCVIHEGRQADRMI